jgi:hypothetical protein
MKKRYVLTIGFLVLLSALVAFSAWADVPLVANYQGQLLDQATGNPLDGDFDMEFRIYDEASLGTLLWSESHSDVEVREGIYNVTLGSVNPLDPADFDLLSPADNRWLEIRVEGEAFSPRQQCTSVLFAINADRLDGMDSTEFAESTHSHAGSDITGTVPNADRVDGQHASAFAPSTHSHALGDLGGTVTDAQVPNNITINFAAQAGNADTVDGEHASAFADAVHGHSFSQITGSASDAQIPNNITINYAASAGNADTVDGKHASAFAGSSHWHFFLNASDGSPTNAVVADALGDVAMGGTVTNPDGFGLYVQNYSFGKAAVRGTDQSGASIYAEGRLGVLSPSGLPYNPYNIGVLGIKPNLGANGAAVYGWNNDGNSANYAMYAVADGAASGTNYTNYGIYAKAANASRNYAGYFEGPVRVDSANLDLVDASDNVGLALQPDGYGTGGALRLYDADGTETVSFYAAETTTTGAQLYLKKADGTTTIDMDADWFGDEGGYIAVRNDTGSTTISLYGDYSGTGDGRIITQELQITGGSDLSEQFDIEKLGENIKPGMLVSIDPERPGKLMISAEPYDNKVAGVISGAGGIKPGMLMGQEGTKADGAHPVALTGRVYCWVDASEASVRPGDLLTTSVVPGHAMKVKDHQRALGAIIGKAMTSLEKGRGLVLVLVSLQ